MAANTPSLPHNEGDTFTNEETGIKYQFINGAWRAVSSKAAEDVADALGQLDLQKVLDNGNVADKGIELTDGGIKTKGDSTLKIGQGETITIDSGSSFEPMLHLKSYTTTSTTDLVDTSEYGTRARKDVLIIDARGDAQLLGKLSLSPGTQGTEAVTYNQLVEIEEELESLVPSIERGKYDLLMTNITVDDTGKFNLYEGFSEAEKNRREQACADEKDACIRNPDLDQIDCETDYDRCMLRIPNVGTGHYVTDNFATVNRIKFNVQDVDGVTHNWESVKPGMMIDVFNEEDDSYMLAEVTATNGMWYEMVDIDVNVIQYKGKATGRCRIKVFELDLSAGNDTDFVRKQGTNKVESNWKITSENKTHFHVEGDKTKIYWLQDPKSDQHPVTLSYANANYGTKEYIDNAIAEATAPAPARYGWTVELGNTTGQPADGNVLMQTGSISTKSNLILSRTPTVGPQLYLRQNRLIFEGKFIVNNTERINPQVFTVWDRANDQWRWKGTADIHYMQWNAEGNLIVQCGNQVHWNNVDSGSVLYFNIAGFI